jgi:hypothetical protein
VLSDTATCTGGQVLLGGGGQITTAGSAAGKVALEQSFPSSTTVWTASLLVTSNVTGAGTNTATIKAYAICGNP